MPRRRRRLLKLTDQRAHFVDSFLQRHDVVTSEQQRRDLRQATHWWRRSGWRTSSGSGGVRHDIAQGVERGVQVVHSLALTTVDLESQSIQSSVIRRCLVTVIITDLRASSSSSSSSCRSCDVMTSWLSNATMTSTHDVRRRRVVIQCRVRPRGWHLSVVRQQLINVHRLIAVLRWRNQQQLVVLYGDKWLCNACVSTVRQLLFGTECSGWSNDVAMLRIADCHWLINSPLSRGSFKRNRFTCRELTCALAHTGTFSNSGPLCNCLHCHMQDINLKIQKNTMLLCLISLRYFSNKEFFTSHNVVDRGVLLAMWPYVGGT